MAQTGSRLGLGITLAARPAYEPEAVALFARMSVQPGAARRGAINTVIVGLKRAGVWARLDAFYMLAAHDAQAAGLNWIGPSFNLTAANSPAFEADRGFTGNGATAYLDTGFNPVTSGGRFALNDAHLGIWCRTDVAEDRNDIGNFNARIFTRNSGNGISGRMNDNVAPAGIPSVTSAVGHTVFSREASTGYRIDRQGVVRTTLTSTATAMTSTNFWILAANGTTFSTKQVSCAHFGASLTAIQSEQAYQQIAAYLAA